MRRGCLRGDGGDDGGRKYLLLAVMVFTLVVMDVVMEMIAIMWINDVASGMLWLCLWWHERFLFVVQVFALMTKKKLSIYVLVHTT